MRQFAIFFAMILLLAACSGGNETTPSPTPIEEPSPEATPETVAQDPTGRPWFGIGFGEGVGGELNVFVDPGGPAEAAGIRNGDILTAINNTNVDAETLVAMFQTFKVGDVLNVTVLRDGEAMDFEVRLGVQPEGQSESASLGASAIGGYTFEITESGITLLEVAPGSPADESGLQAGDRIIAVDTAGSDDPEAVAEALQDVVPRSSYILSVERAGEIQAITLTIPEVPVSVTQSVPISEGIPQEIVQFLPEDTVWLVERTVPNGVLETVGLVEGDTILAINGAQYTQDELRAILNSTTPDDIITLSVLRDEAVIELEGPGMIVPALLTASFNVQQETTNNVPQAVPTSPPPTPPGVVASTRTAPSTIVPFFLQPPTAERAPLSIGVDVIPVSEEIAASSGLDAAQGALVLGVQFLSPAMRAGVQIDDVILSVNGDPVDEENPLSSLLQDYAAGDTVTLVVVRGGEELALDVQVEQERTSLPFISPQQGSEGEQNVPFQFPTAVPLPIFTQPADDNR